MAVRKWLYSLGYELDVMFPDFTGKYRYLKIGKQRVEIKGLKYAQWPKYKRMVAPGPLDFYVKNNAIIVWALADADAVTSRVTLKGYNLAKDVKQNGT